MIPNEDRPTGQMGVTPVGAATNLKPAIDATEAPEGYRAVREERLGWCIGCAFCHPGADLGPCGRGCPENAGCRQSERKDGCAVIFKKIEKCDQDIPEGFDPKDAPLGYVAIPVADGMGCCDGCAFRSPKEDCPEDAHCMKSERADKCSAIFKKIEPAKAMTDAEINAAFVSETRRVMEDAGWHTAEDQPAPENAKSAMESAGMKFDLGKPRMELLDRHFLEQTAMVLTYGAKKYSAWNWADGVQYSRYIGAAMRHITAYNDGEDLDPESGLSHIAHASCCLMILLGMERRHPEMDDRFKFEVQK